MRPPQSRAALTTPVRMTASGIAIVGGALVSGIKVIARGTAGNLAVYEGVDAAGPVRYPSTVYTSLADDQFLRFSRGLSQFANMYLTLPTGAVVLVYMAPR